MSMLLLKRATHTTVENGTFYNINALGLLWGECFFNLNRILTDLESLNQRLLMCLSNVNWLSITIARYFVFSTLFIIVLLYRILILSTFFFNLVEMMR